MSLFVDSSAWFASVVARDRYNERAKTVLREAGQLVTTDHVLVETWLLLATRHTRRGAEMFWDGIRQGGVRVEKVTDEDMETASDRCSRTRILDRRSDELRGYGTAWADAGCQL